MTVPPLRERKEDIPRLASYFARRIALQLNRKDQGFTPGAVKAMNKYAWPGNVRELRNVIERSMVLAGDRLIRPEDLNLTAQLLTTVNPFIDVINLPYDQARKRVLSRFRSVYLKSLLKMNNDNITKAAKQSGLSRSSLHRMIKEDSEEK
jgi:DNA-binding NtrC family response regulator